MYDDNFMNACVMYVVRGHRYRGKIVRGVEGLMQGLKTTNISIAGD